jgi:hypothetical protein
MGDLDPLPFINAETLCIPFRKYNVFMVYWVNSFRPWPSDIPSWRDWYRRISVDKFDEWDNLGIAHCINL